MHTRRRIFGFSLLELILASVILSTTLAVAMTALGMVARSQRTVMDRRLATTLAHSLLHEILCYPYEDPGDEESQAYVGDDPPIVTRPTKVFRVVESVEDGMLAEPTSYVSVDDFHGSNCMPPCETDGSVISELATVRRRVAVENVQLDDPDLVSGTDQGVKRVTVTVEVDGREMARVVGLKTRHD